MESKQLAVYLIMGGAVIVALKFITEIISFILKFFYFIIFRDHFLNFLNIN